MNGQSTRTGDKVSTLRTIRLHRSWCAGFPEDTAFDADGFAAFDMAIADGRITAITKPEDEAPLGRIVSPLFVDCHTHIDKGHIWARSPNPDGSFMGALETVGNDRRENWSAADVEARMEFALKCAFAHGTRHLRTHLDSLPPQEDISWPVFQTVRERWKGRIDLQAACLFGIDAARDEAWFNRLAGIVAKAGGVLGTVTFMVPDLEPLLDRVFAKAMDLGLELDFHADETDDIEARSLGAIARAARRHGYKGRILIGHCCSLARQPDDVVLRTLDDVASVDISVVSLPMCNMYLQDRRQNATTPRWRGVTLLHEMKARGINVCVASDNTRDPFYAYGDLDMLEVYRMATRTCHFDHPVGDWPKTVFANPAKAMGIAEPVIEPGAPADFMIYQGRTWTELLSRPESNRIMIRGGTVIERQIPDYQELDHLMEQQQ